MERPKEVVWFERIYLGTLALGVIQSWLGWPDLIKMGSPPLFILATQLFVFGLIGGLTLLISRRRSNVAKWILIALFVAGLPIFIGQLLDGQPGTGSPAISLIQTIGQIMAFCLLFTAAARTWFKREATAEAGAL